MCPEESESGLPYEPFIIFDQDSNERLWTGSAPAWQPDSAQFFANISATLYDSNPLKVLSTRGGGEVLSSEQFVTKNKNEIRKIFIGNNVVTFKSTPY